MGSLKPVSKWIPEDDLLLKNAVEAGASLESLAKGAVCFSHRFTLQQLRDRWHCLLYDLDTSVEASARIIEIDVESSVPNPYKASETCDYKGKDGSFGKRKLDSVRSNYNCMRKRVCNKPCTSAGLRFLVPPGPLVGTDSDHCCGNQFKPQDDHPENNFAAGAALSDHNGDHDIRCDNVDNAVPELVRVDSSAVAANNINNCIHHTVHFVSIKDKLPEGIVGNDCFYGSKEGTPPMSVDKAGYNAEKSFVHDYVQKDFSQIPKENLVTLEDRSGVQEIRQPNAEHSLLHSYTRNNFSPILEENLIPVEACSDIPGTMQPQIFPMSNLYEEDNVEVKTLHGFDSINASHEGLHHDLPLQVVDSDDSFHQHGYSAAQAILPLWTMEDITTPTIPLGGHFTDKDQEMLPVDGNEKMELEGCDGATKLHDGVPSGELVMSTVSDDNVDISSYDEDFYFLDVEVEEVEEEPCLNDRSSVLLSSSETHQDDIANPSDPIGSTVLDLCLGTTDGSTSSDSDDLCDQLHSGNDDNPTVSTLETSVPAKSSYTYHTAEPFGVPTSCVLNSENWDIPFNNKASPLSEVSLACPSSDLDRTSIQNSVAFSSVKALSNYLKPTVGGSTTVMEKETVTPKSLVSSRNAGSSVLPKMDLVPSSDGCKVEDELFKGDSLHGVPNSASIPMHDPHPLTSETIRSQCFPVATVKEESKIMNSRKNVNFDAFPVSLLAKPVQGSGNTKRNFRNTTDGCRQVSTMHDTITKLLPSHADLVSREMGFSHPIESKSFSDQEAQLSDTENEVPNFSDIESLILDMDLGPYDQESCPFTKEVSRYQCVDMRKGLSRLEQGAHSYMNRDIAFRGAFAIFWGRCMKYYIKHPKVSIGRATEEVEVDIDLGREGRANKISRLQAIIKLEEDGNFVLSNIGKCSIFVNGQELQSKRRMNLCSHSLLEIRDMTFAFVINKGAVRRYITAQRSNGREQSGRFSFVPVQNP